MRFKILFSLCLILLAAGSTLAGDEVPQWLQQAAAITPPAYDKDVPAVVLLNDQKITVSEDGHGVAARTSAASSSDREGRDEAMAREVYQADTGKVRDLQAWLVLAGGPAKHYGKDRIVDIALATDDVYNEYRVKAM